MTTPLTLLAGTTSNPVQQILNTVVSTVDATPTIVQTLRPAANTSTLLWIKVIGVRIGVRIGTGATSNYIRSLRAKRVGSTTTITAVDTIGTDTEDEAATALAVAVAANNLDVTVTATGVVAESYFWSVNTTSCSTLAFA
jgi:hypothetical protein